MDSIVFGNLRIQLLSQHGGQVERVTVQALTPQVRLRQPQATQAGDDGLLGRADLVDETLRLLGTGQVQAVEFHGACGFGKSSLLRHLAARLDTDTPTPTTWLQAGRERVDDLLQRLCDAFYHADAPFKPTETQRSMLLGQLRAVVLLDDVLLDPDQVERMLSTLPGCIVVLATDQPTVGRHGRSIALVGLPDEAALRLITRDLGRAPAEREHTDIQRLCRAVDGQPLHLRQAAALVGRHGFSFEQLADRAEEDPHVLDRLSVNALAEQERRILAVLALAGGGLLPRTLIESMSDVADIGERLASLRRRGLVEQDEDRFGLPICQVEGYRRLLLKQLKLGVAVRELSGWLRERPATSEEARSSAKAAVVVIGWLAARAEWPAVVRLVEVVEPILTLAGQWEACRDILHRGLQAAQATGDRAAEALFSHQLGTLELCRDQLDGARELLTRALDLRQQLGDDAGAAVTRHNLELLAPVTPTKPVERRHDATERSGPRRWLGAARRSRLGVLLARGGVLALVGGLLWFLGPGHAKSPPSPSGFAVRGDLTFPATPLNQTGPPVAFSVTSRGPTGITVGAITLEGQAPGDFTVQDECTGRTVTQTAGCRLAVSFHPSNVGVRTAEVVVTATTPDVRSVVRLQGAGAATADRTVVTPSPSATATSVETVTLPAPTLTATAVSATRVRLTWVTPAGMPTGVHYIVYRDDQTISSAVTAVTYDDTKVAPGRSYTYQVRAVDAAGHSSSRSNVAQATTPQGAVAPVTVNIDPCHWQAADSGWDAVGPLCEANPVIARYGATHTHAYGNDIGTLAYRFTLPAVAHGRAEVSARLSSNFPGYTAPSDGFSDVTLTVNGHRYPAKRVIPDNGSGRVYTWQVDPHDLTIGANTLQFSVDQDATYRHGLCVYAKAVAQGYDDYPITVRVTA